MADQFQTFDKAPIIGIVKVHKWSFGLREIILAAIAVLLLLMCLTFAGLFGKAESDLVATQKSAAFKSCNKYCTSVGCLRTAARSLELMNTSVDPCEDFYQYACGNYQNLNPTLPHRGWSRNVLADMRDYNEDLIKSVVEKPIEAWHDTSSEKKLKQFFVACNDLFQRQKLRGTPFLRKVVAELGGWKVIGTWNSSTWNWQHALKKVQVDFWVDAVYAPRVWPDTADHTRNVIVLHPGGVGKFMNWRWYVSTSPYTQRYRDDYKKFIRRVATYLARDAHDVVPDSMPDQAQVETYIDEFVNDTFAMESHIAHLGIHSDYDEDPYHDSNKVTLRQLTEDTGNVIDWVDQMTYFFNRVTISGSTKVVVQQKEYFRNLTSMISSLPDEDRNRMLHNYLIWRVAEIYAQDLSWEYIHANREIYEDTRHRSDFMGLYRYCHLLARIYMSDALSALYIKDFFDKDKRTEVHNITDNIKKAVLSQLDKTPWMDKPTKAIAREKLDHVVFKMGYPDWLENQGFVDSMYGVVEIDIRDFFGSLLSLNQFHRQEWNSRLNQIGHDREEWDFPVYYVRSFYNPSWNEVAATAGILQTPIYDPKQPYAATFGSLGALIGLYIHYVVNEYGQFYDKVGNYLEDESWWSNATIEAYSDNKECIRNSYKNVTKKIVRPDGTVQVKKIDIRYYTGYAMAYTSGIKLALIGYQDWLQAHKKQEKMVPGTDLTNRQMLFVSQAQTHCFYTHPIVAYWRAMFGRLQWDDKINIAMSQLPEFSEAFSCKVGSRMNHQTKCQYY